MYIIKQPKFEDDSYYFVLNSGDELADVVVDGYLQAKRQAWLECDPGKSTMGIYLDRPSFGADRAPDIRGSVYTKSIEDKNDGMHYKRVMELCRHLKSANRRCVVRLADSFGDYQDFNRVAVSTSCLNIMHFYKDRVTLFFRASDIRNELLYDLHLIREFFIDNVFNVKEYFEIHVIASTAQNTDMNLNNLIK